MNNFPYVQHMNQTINLLFYGSVGLSHFKQSSKEQKQQKQHHLVENYPIKEVRTVPVVPGKRPALAIGELNINSSKY